MLLRTQFSFLFFDVSILLLVVYVTGRLQGGLACSAWFFDFHRDMPNRDKLL
jgi:hypothetical protein